MNCLCLNTKSTHSTSHFFYLTKCFNFSAHFGGIWYEIKCLFFLQHSAIIRRVEIYLQKLVLSLITFCSSCSKITVPQSTNNEYSSGVVTLRYFTGYRMVCRNWLISIYFKLLNYLLKNSLGFGLDDILSILKNFCAIWFAITCHEN